MPKYFVCRAGSIGGVSIKFVSENLSDAQRWAIENANTDEPFFIYEQICEVLA